ncbi:MAG: TonB-dependent receptor [Deltaproteobacteria bacterium]|nr:TonB-dependent receptor [Candidatus Anaeroferrophillacea bacterium]
MKWLAGVLAAVLLAMLPPVWAVADDGGGTGAGPLPAEESAAETAAMMGSIIVTAERFPGAEISTPRFVTVIAAEELVESGANNLVDALKRVGGLAYKAYAPLGISHGGMNSKVAIRGIYDGELVLLNGAPIQGSAGHAYDLNTIPLDQIERIEILKGAASTLYGADAMTGVINIITKKATATTAYRIALEGGNEDYHNHSLSAALPGFNLGLNYQHLGDQREISRSFTKGYRYDLDASDKFALNFNANPWSNVYVDYLGSYYESGFRKQFDGPGKQYEGTDQEHEKHFADMRYETEVFKAKIYGAFEEMRRDEYTGSDPKDNNRNFNYGLSCDYRLPLTCATWLVGVDYTYFGADYNNKYGYHYRNDYALFSQVKKELFDRLTLTVGLRQQFVDGEPGTDDYDRLLPSFGADLKIDETFHLFGNLGRAFRSPTFNQQYYESAFMVGNPDLGPEEGWTYEAGVKWDHRYVILRLAAFYMDYEDKIEIDRRHGFPQTYFNAGNYRSTGIEWELTGSPFAGIPDWRNRLSAYCNGYWADPEAEDAEGVSYQAGPEFQATCGIKFLGDRLTIDLNSQTLAGRERELDEYTTVNFYGKLQLGSGWLTLAVDNLFDEKVQVSGDLSSDASNRYLYYDLDGPLVKVGYELVF